MTWTEADVPDQTGRVAVITGANTGIGFQAARVLADQGASVVLAVRDVDKGRAARSQIIARNPRAHITVQRLDLSSLASVRAAADALRTANPHIDLLINNAGVMFTPEGVTADGIEFQFATNHLGHFALCGLLLDNMLAVRGSRVVTISSLGHRLRGSTSFDDVHAPYDRVAAYGRSKLANLLFTYELQRRLSAHDAGTVAVAAHPGNSRTGLFRNSPGWMRVGSVLLAPVFSQSSAMGALPTLRAATDPAARGGEYFGPAGLAEQRGHPAVVQSSAQSHDDDLQRQVWKISEELSGVAYPV
jgi:NAD(P)-dependent dehydrogenase (short-subunit alcohol dehydrogenase family)